MYISSDLCLYKSIPHLCIIQHWSMQSCNYWDIYQIECKLHTRKWRYSLGSGLFKTSCASVTSSDFKVPNALILRSTGPVNFSFKHHFNTWQGKSISQLLDQWIYMHKHTSLSASRCSWLTYHWSECTRYIVSVLLHAETLALCRNSIKANWWVLNG